MKIPMAARASPSTSRARWSSTGKGCESAENIPRRLAKAPRRERRRVRRDLRAAGDRGFAERERRAGLRAGARLRVGAIPRNFDTERREPAARALLSLYGPAFR